MAHVGQSVSVGATSVDRSLAKEFHLHDLLVDFIHSEALEGAWSALLELLVDLTEDCVHAFVIAGAGVLEGISLSATDCHIDLTASR